MLLEPEALASACVKPSLFLLCLAGKVEHAMAQEPIGPQTWAAPSGTLTWAPGTHGLAWSNCCSIVVVLGNRSTGVGRARPWTVPSLSAFAHGQETPGDGSRCL